MIAISILGIKDNNEKIKEIDDLKPDYVHLDVMDGFFVPNKTDLTNILPLKSKTDVHLMVNDIMTYINQYKSINPEYITFHLEAADKPLEIINYIHSLGIKVGMSIKPNTKVSEIAPYLPYLDLVLVMSVEPGLGGQSFILDSVDKVKELKELRNLNNYQFVIEIDGGVNNTTFDKCEDVDIKVVGSYITDSDNYSDRLNILKNMQ